MNELVYTLDSATKEGLIITLGDKNGGKTFSAWKTLASKESDKQALEALLKEEMAYQKKLTGKTAQIDSLILHKIHVSTPQSIPILQLIASKLYFDKNQLVCDFYGKVDFYYEIVPLPNNKIEVHGRLKSRSSDIPLTECSFIGPGKPHWFVHGISLKVIATDISWKELQLARAPRTLEGSQKALFLEEAQDEGIEVVIKDASLQEIQQQNDPHPLLILKDRLGAFADLWMDYGNASVKYDDPHDIIKGDKGEILFKRLRQAEKGWEKDLLETDFIKKTVGNSEYYCPVDKIAKSLTFLLEIGWQIRDWKNARVIRHDTFKLNMEEVGDIIAIRGKVCYGDHEADASAVVGAFNRREHFVQLNGGTVGLLPPKENQFVLQDIADDVEIVGQDLHVKKSHFGTLSTLFHQAQVSPSLESLKEKWTTFTGIQEVKTSTNFKGELRPYQQIGLNWLSFLDEFGFHGILADEMGLGKTVQVLAMLSCIETTQPHLIVLPTSLLFNWKNEIHRFLPHFSCYVHQGPHRNKSIEELSQHSIILTSYTTLRIDFPLFQKIPFYGVILDEAQMIKNAHTQTAQSVYGLTAKLRLCITGTPVENHLNELWSHFHFLIPDLFGSLESFEADVSAAQSDKRYLDRIRRKIAPFILRRRKQEVAKDLPERIDQVMWIEMSEEQREMYDQFLSGLRGGLLKKVEADGMGKHRMEILEAILRLRQICCHPHLVSSLTDEAPLSTNAKFDALCEDLETIVEEGGKVLVYSQFTSMLKIMAKYAKEKGWNYAYLDGSTKDREKVVTAFQEDPSQNLFFISLKAGGVGLNLTAADYVYLYDPWWNNAVEEQAINRAHRIGRHDKVIAKRFVTVESIEEKMMKLKAAKSLVVEELFDSEVTPHNLTVDDLYFLLS
jgi:superfamily II DNA or RNA helicase